MNEYTENAIDAGMILIHQNIPDAPRQTVEAFCMGFVFGNPRNSFSGHSYDLPTPGELANAFRAYWEIVPKD